MQEQCGELQVQRQHGSLVFSLSCDWESRTDALSSWMFLSKRTTSPTVRAGEVSVWKYKVSLFITRTSQQRLGIVFPQVLLLHNNGLGFRPRFITCFFKCMNVCLLFRACCAGFPIGKSLYCWVKWEVQYEYTQEWNEYSVCIWIVSNLHNGFLHLTIWVGIINTEYIKQIHYSMAIGNTLIHFYFVFVRLKSDQDLIELYISILIMPDYGIILVKTLKAFTQWL